MATTSTSWPSMLAGIISESKRVVSAHTRHFLALSVLFLLPLSSLLLFLPSLLLSPFPPPSSSPLHPQSLLRSPPPPLSLPLSLLLSLSLLLLLLSLSALSSISLSTLNSFFSRPVKLLPSLSSIPSSLLRLVLTVLLPLLLLFPLLLLSFILFPFLFFALFSLSLLLVLLSLNLSLAFPIAVLESTWGIQSIHRSNHLIRGMRWAAFCLHLFFLTGIGLIGWGFSLREIRGFGDWRYAVPVVGRTVFGTAVMMVMLLYWMVSGVVMYLYCKALHGELAAEMAAEFAWEYVCLPFDQQKGAICGSPVI